MHTTTLLTVSDFECRRIAAGAALPLDALVPGHDPRDRVGVVSPLLEDGVVGCGAALLALAAAFYAPLRERGGEFFDYPRHFALVGGAGGAVATRGGAVPLAAAPLRASWGNLDVWPETNWIVVAPSATAMLDQAWRLQLDRLFWPAALAPAAAPDAPVAGPDAASPDPAARGAAAAPLLPALARTLLAARLRSVLVYGDAAPDLELRASPRAVALLARSRAVLQGLAGDAPPGVERFRRVEPLAFLDSMAACFAAS